MVCLTHRPNNIFGRYFFRLYITFRDESHEKPEVSRKYAEPCCWSVSPVIRSVAMSFEGAKLPVCLTCRANNFFGRYFFCFCITFERNLMKSIKFPENRRSHVAGTCLLLFILYQRVRRKVKVKSRIMNTLRQMVKLLVFNVVKCNPYTT